MGALVGVAIGGLALAALTVIAAIVIIVLSIVILCRCHKQNDKARTGVTYLKVTCGFILLSQVLVVISAVLGATTRGYTTIQGVDINVASAHMSAISTVTWYASYALFIATQFEFARGLKFIAALSGHGEGANFVEVKARKSRMFNIFALVLVMVVALGSFGLYEAWIAGNENVGVVQGILSFVVEAVLSVSAIICLIFTVRQPRIPPHNGLGTHLIVISTLTAIRHLASAAITAFIVWGANALIEKEKYTAAGGVAIASVVAVLAGSWTFCITLGMAYGVCRKEYGGLRANSAYAPVKGGHV